jgi:hypothetical protein
VRDLRYAIYDLRNRDIMKTARHEMAVWRSKEDEAYAADVPELPGCMAHGKRRQEAFGSGAKRARL